MKFKLPEGCGDRRESIESLLESESRTASENLIAVKQAVERLLLENKGYSVSEIELDPEFDVTTGSGPGKSKVDFVIRLNGKRLVSIKCSADTLVSRERQALACARLLESYQVPFAVITDGADAVVLDTVSGKTIGEGLEAVPSREALEILAPRIEFKELPPDRVEREKRIVCAFDAMGCGPALL
ncbi:MAG: hypothetical protein C4526_11145 [Nitrospiraceae bacterium]|nr:MAG: hypothetical protein C4526_11145 [Nitrospiraceae bacterium]